MDVIAKLAREISPTKLPKQPVDLVFGVVTATAAGPPATVTVKISGSTTATAGLRYLSSYTPSVNDTVLILSRGSDFVVVGKLA